MDNSIQKTILLPRLERSKNKIAGNFNLHLTHPESLLIVDVFQDSPTTYILKDRFGREYGLKISGARRDIDKLFVLRAKSLADINDLTKDTKLSWEKHPRLDAPETVSEIKATWKGKFTFQEEDVVSNKYGLRKPQLGAIHAVASHWSTSNDVATVVMPTGTGKTEVMLSILISELCDRVLIVVPSNILREQIFNKFSHLGCLADVGVITDDVSMPRVSKVERGLSTVTQAEELADSSNVLVATASVLSKFSKEALGALLSKCSHMFVDEAHHVPAATWADVVLRFGKKPVLQFTATPFRNDGKRVAGRIIYDYPLGMAQDNGYFKRINLLRVNEIDEAQSDRVIAETAIKQLREDVTKNELDHLLMARAKSIARANDIQMIYDELAPDYKPIVISDELTKAQKESFLSMLKTRESRIVICVDMLGEGFDLPNLKIAAMHDIHKSLPVTMQFVGRFTRISNENIGEATVVVNTADPKVDKKLEALYSENPDWNELLRQESESAISYERRIQDVIHNFKGELFQQISLWNLRPSFSTLMYKTNSQQWYPDDFLEKTPSGLEKWSAINEHEKMIVVVANKEEDVSWGKYRDIHNQSFELCVAYWNQEVQMLFIQCSNYDVFNTDALARALCGESARLHNGMRLFHVFNDVDLPMVKNLGASRTGTISYTMYFGPEVIVGLSQIDKMESTPNNIFGWGYEEGNVVTYGCSAKSGKLWSRGGGTVLDFKEWCDHVQSKIPAKDDGDIKVISGFLRPNPLNGRHEFVAHTIEWGDGLTHSTEKNVSIFFGRDERKLYEVDIEPAGYGTTGPIEVKISSDAHESIYRMVYTPSATGDSEGQYKLEHVSGQVVSVKKYSGIQIDLIEYEKRDPLIARYVDGSFSYGNYHVEVPSPDQLYDLNNLTSREWTVNIKKESQGKEVDTDTIQYATIQSIIDEYDIIINDDDKGEVADIIAIRKNVRDETYTVHLFHCKFSHTASPGGDLRNLYEVCGQAQKSILWKHAGIEGLVEHLKPRENKWAESGHTRFVKGSMSDLHSIKKMTRFAKMVFKMTIVQPGLSKAAATEAIAQLIGSTENYVFKTTGAELEVICSN